MAGSWQKDALVEPKSERDCSTAVAGAAIAAEAAGAAAKRYGAAQARAASCAGTVAQASTSCMYPPATYASHSSARSLQTPSGRFAAGCDQARC